MIRRWLLYYLTLNPSWIGLHNGGGSEDKWITTKLSVVEAEGITDAIRQGEEKHGTYAETKIRLRARRATEDDE